MAETEKYKRAKELREQLDKKAAELLPQVEEFKQLADAFYELMRWERLGCADEEYSALYDNFIYPYEEGRISTALEDVQTFLDPNKRDSL